VAGWVDMTVQYNHSQDSFYCWLAVNNVFFSNWNANLY